jgi:Mrp family chromosome partitioning ATPase
MSSLNQAFIKAYGRDASATSEAAPPAPAPSPPQSQVLGNWYSADAWYRAESAVVPQASSAPIAAPHVSFPPAPAVAKNVAGLADSAASYAYQPPERAELSQLVARRATLEEIDYRLSPAESVPPPEVIVEDEPAALQAVVAPPPPPAPAAKAEPAPARAPKTPPPAPLDPPPPTPAVVVAPQPSLDQLFAPVQFTAGWESTLGMFNAVTTVAPQPASLPTPAPVAKAEPQPELKPVPAPSAPPPAKVPPPAPVVTPRLDAAVAPPVPKPHTNFTPPAPKAPDAAVVEAPQPAPIEAKAGPAPLGLVQPAWEVDRFQWPEHCKLLLNTESEYLADVGKRLANAAQDGLNILAITSTRRGEGRTTLALCLARAAAQAGVKVALVDADMENPQLINELGVEAACGWQDVVLGTQPLAEAAIVSLDDRFTFFPWTPGGALKSLNDPRATRVLREIAKAYSLVILDLGPVPGRETRMFEDGDACPIDAAILVRDVRWTSAVEAQRVAGQLTEAGVESVGIAENFGPKQVASGQ